MEQDIIAGLYHSLGLSVGAEFSSEDVSLLYRKVFHVPSSTEDAHAAMKKIAGDDESFFCVGEHVLDVLLEMLREKEKKEELYWDLQLLNADRLNTFYATEKPVAIDPPELDFLHQSTDRHSVKKTHRHAKSERPAEKKEPSRNVKSDRRIRKAAAQCWTRLASEGVQSLLPTPDQGQSPGVRCQAWGLVSLSEVLLLVEVKYDVVSRLIYREMLQEHHTLSVWETLLPWQQYKEEEGLEDLAEEALESGEMLFLAELPGAFRIYRSRCGSREESWSAVSFLCELHRFRQHERDTLSVLGRRLDRESLCLLSLHIRFATLRAQREKTSHGALLAARQSWETWPNVTSPCRAEQMAIWLRDGEEEPRKDFISLSPQQQAVLQLLVLTQEQERKHLVKLVRGVSPEDMQGYGSTAPRKEDSHAHEALRNGCIKRLRQIHAGLQTQNVTRIPLMKTDTPTQVERVEHSSKRAMLEDCSLLLLTHLTERQEAQTSTLLLALTTDTGTQRVQALRDEFESNLLTQRSTNLLHVLISDGPLTPDSVCAPYPNLEDSSGEQINSQNNPSGPVEAPTTDLVTRASRELHVAQAPVEPDDPDVCTGYEVTMEDLPYLEILCVSDSTSNGHQSEAAEERSHEEETKAERNATGTPQSYEKQGSLIALAWSKPLETDTDCEAEADAGSTDQIQDAENSLTHVQLQDISEMAKPTEQRTEKDDVQTHTVTEEEPQDAPPYLVDDLDDTEQRDGELCSGFNRGEVEMCPTEAEADSWDPRSPESVQNEVAAVDCGPAEREATRESTVLDMERAREPVSAVERERTIRNLVDMQRKVEQRQQRDKERQLLRIQERLSIIQNRKAEEDLLGLKHTDRLRHLTHDLPQEDKNQQKTVVRERLDHLRRERSCIMQSKRDRNTAGFKELLGPVALPSIEADDEANWESKAA